MMKYAVSEYQNWILSLLIFLLMGCGPAPQSPQLTRDDLVGVWLRMSSPQDAPEGLVLGKDGSAAILGVSAVSVISWDLSGNELRLQVMDSNVKRDLPTELRRVVIEREDADKLHLQADQEYFSGDYQRRQDSAIALRGEVVWPEGTLRKNQGVLNLSLVPANESEAIPMEEKVSIAMPVVTIGGRQHFSFYLLKHQITPGVDYRLSAKVWHDAKLGLLTKVPPLALNANGDSVEKLTLDLVAH
ncbi:lipocalin family protein [Corallincola platygyrae]|uniref:Lipocalin family protein n=1 Tax=Corallincola platygyrae TaxID=1193278 RepID=A0ABW4XNP7_9GAMM